jgi:Zn-dependent peptidase ImmA (M78 family)/DNA-binding XRE family transcriptional regulator
MSEFLLSSKQINCLVLSEKRGGGIMLGNILDKIDLRQLGERLQRARKRQGLTQEDAARLIDVARTTITAIEKGERRIRASELMRLAEAYGRELSDFVSQRPQIGDFQVQFRSALARTQADDERIAASIEALQELCTDYFELEQMLQRPLVRNYPTVYQYDRRRLEQAAESLARRERNRFGVDEGPLPPLRALLEQIIGLRIFYLPLEPSSKFSEIYTFEPTLGGCIAVNIHHPPERCRWSLAHAYAHFLADRTKPVATLEEQNQRKSESERFADAFARYFLMPTAGLTQRFNAIYEASGRTTPADLVKLAHYYGVSVEAMTRRLEDMRLVPTGLWERLQERGFKVKEAQEKLGLQEVKEPKDRFPERYVKLAIDAYEADEISEGELAHYLRTDLLDARTLVEERRLQEPSDAALEQDLLTLVEA